MTRTGIIAAALGLATIVFVLFAAQGMRDSGFVVRAYSITAIILAWYTWSIGRRLQQVERNGEKEEGGSH